jgi:hypothetical protein
VPKKALENVLGQLTSKASQKPPPPVQSADRVGSRLGEVSELTIIVLFAPGGAQRLRAGQGNPHRADHRLARRDRGGTRSGGSGHTRVLRDERARGGGTRHVLFETLVRIPLGTALPEEVIFRGSLLGLFTQRHSPAVAASMSSILFGVWRVLPTLRTLPLNPAGARVHGNPMRTAGVVLATVTATTLAGYGLAWLRFRSVSIAAPVVAHASLNGAAYLAARFVIDAAAPQPGRHG